MGKDGEVTRPRARERKSGEKSTRTEGQMPARWTQDRQGGDEK